jgi:hypothetical protein
MRSVRISTSDRISFHASSTIFKRISHYLLLDQHGDSQKGDEALAGSDTMLAIRRKAQEGQWIEELTTHAQRGIQEKLNGRDATKLKSLDLDAVGTTWRRQWPWRANLGGDSGPGARRLRVCMVDEEGDTADGRGIASS